ncbi:hypothetical protein PAHAL_2G323000 [Panicum hallii]|uniref:Vacuolar iron transporter n=1 Tax=Panicum hallii TaxID=206008 RepID=A0A2T8KR58_9POAL|nr:hypothetical protein PAHAL_2G323000 [Panicum hallii]
MALNGGKTFVQDEEKQRLLLEPGGAHREALHGRRGGPGHHHRRLRRPHRALCARRGALRRQRILHARAHRGARGGRRRRHLHGARRVPGGEERGGPLQPRAAARAGGDRHRPRRRGRRDRGHPVVVRARPRGVRPVVTTLRNNPKAWLEFMMKFELGLEKPEPRRALVSAATIALSYVAGGLVPLLPYVFVPRAERAMAVSVAVTLAALLFFGFVKGRFTGDRPFLSVVQTTVVGALASAAAYAMARAVQSI